MRRIIFSALVLSGVIANAQDYKGRVGINTETPRATLEVKAVTVDGRAQGILFPHITNEEKDKWKKDDAKGLVAGTVIWNTNKNCLDYFDGTLWRCVDGSNPSVPSNKTITLPQQISIINGEYWIASIYDTKYLPYSAPTTAASWTRGEDGGPDTKIDVKGTIPSAGISVKIPIKVTANATLPAYTAYALTPAEAWNDRTAKILELSWEQQSLTASSTIITATIKVKDATADQNLIQLDLVKGLGSEYKGLLLGQFKMPSTSAQTTPNAYTGTYDVRVISGIPDRNFGKTTTLTGSTTAELLHQFIYEPVQAEDGRIWLNNNLGADYARVPTGSKPNPYFNPVQQATKKDDWKAYGSLFQWQRKADGHELIQNRSDSTPLGTTSEQVNTQADDWGDVGHSKFIAGPLTWANTQKRSATYNLWQADNTNSNHNPCPNGFHVPTRNEWYDMTRTTDKPTLQTWWATQSKLKLSATGERNYNGYRMEGVGNQMTYWASNDYATSAKIYSKRLWVNEEWGPIYHNYHSVGSPVRCIKD